MKKTSIGKSVRVGGWLGGCLSTDGGRKGLIGGQGCAQQARTFVALDPNGFS